MITTFPAASGNGGGGGLTPSEVRSIVQTGLVNGTIRDVNYTIVSTHAELPAADTKAGETYVVKTASGSASARKKAGLYVSNGTTWVYMGNNVNIDDGVNKLQVEGNLIATRLLAHGLATVATNTAVGADTLTATTTDSHSNTAIGSYALKALTSGHSNTSVGANSLLTNTTGHSNSAYGVSALRLNTTGSSNTGIGINALYSNTTGSSSTALGTNAMLNNTTGASNTGIGTSALKVNTTGAGNTALGSSAQVATTTGSNNSSLGMNSAYANTLGTGNTAMGAYSLFSNITGHYNAAIGMYSLKFKQDGTTLNDAFSYCIGLGYNTKVGGNYAVAIGANASAPAGCIAIGDDTNRMIVGKAADDGVNRLQVAGGISIKPLASATPAANGELVFEATSNTSVKIKLKGSDGVVRSAVLTLA